MMLADARTPRAEDREPPWLLKLEENTVSANQSLSELLAGLRQPASWENPPKFIPEIKPLLGDPDLTGDADRADTHQVTNPPSLKGKSDEEAVETMVDWFQVNFEDSAESTPWDDGEYVYVWGGPHDAREELENAFGEEASEEALEAAVARVESDGWEWAPSSNRIGPVAPTDSVVCAKRRLFDRLTHADPPIAVREGTPGEDFAAAEITIPARDAAVLLGELWRLKQQLLRRTPQADE
jgi:hypothetical protein